MVKDAIRKMNEALKPCTLDFNSDQIGDEKVGLLAEAIKEAQASLTVDLSSSGISTNGIKSLADAIGQVQHTFSLCLVDNSVGFVGAGLLADAIKQAQVPLILDLGFDKITDAGAKLLADAIKSVQFQLNLNLGKNNVGDVVAEALADAIKQMQSPLILDLECNNIGDVGAGLLADAIKRAKVPLVFALPYTNMRSPWTSLLLDAMKDNFVIDAGTDLSRFLGLMKFNIGKRMLEQGLNYSSVLVTLIHGYIGKAELVCIDVAAIRAVDDASHENKYSSINYKLLIATYFNSSLAIQPIAEVAAESLLVAGSEQMEGNHSTSASSAVNETASMSNNDDIDGDKASSSSSGSPGTYPGGGCDVILTLLLYDQQLTVMSYMSSKVQYINYAHQQDLQIEDSKDSTSTSENLLMTLFVWIKDLSEKLQRQVLSSFSMQQVLEMPEATTYQDKFITSQLSSKSVEEIFTAEHQKYYGQDDLTTNLAEYAQQHDSAKLLKDDDGLVVPSGRILADPLLSHDINFWTPYLFEDLGGWYA